MNDPSYDAARAAMIAEGMALGWHQHGTAWVHGLGPGEGCAPCDAIDARWFPRLYAAPLEGATAVAHARRQRIAAAARIGIGPVASTRRLASPDADAIALGAPTRILEALQAPVDQLPLTPPPAAVRSDEDIDDNPPPPDDPPRSSPTFVLTHPTAESIRRHRKKR